MLPRSKSGARVTNSAGKGTLFWVLVASAGACALCSLSTLGLLALGLVGSDDAPTTVTTPMVVSASSGAIPTGDTPDLFPGSPGWLPSGRGVPIPEPELTDGRPQGLWWFPQMQGTKMASMRIIFLPDGTRATHPRPGGPLLFDLEGQKAQRGQTGVGTFEVNDGVITQHYDGFTSTGELSSGEDAEGAWFNIGQMRYRPLAPPRTERLIGTWKSAGGTYVFRDDGTFESGHITDTGVWTVASGGQGTWVHDGYLLQLRPNGAPGWITTIGATGDDFLVIGTVLYKRE